MHLGLIDKGENMTLEKNKMYRLNQVYEKLRVGDFIITNADDAYDQPEFFSATITQINGPDIFVRRTDGEEGGADNGDWTIVANRESKASVMLYDSTVYNVIARENARFGDVVLSSAGFLNVIIHKTSTGKVFFKRFLETVENRPFFERGLDGFKVLFHATLKCSHSNCDSKATKYIPNFGIFCSSHALEYGPVRECTDCGELITQVDSYAVGRGTYVCNRCRAARVEQNRVIKNYSYKPAPVFITVDPIVTEDFLSRIFMGIEQEVECPEEAPRTQGDSEYDEDGDDSLDVSYPDIPSAYGKIFVTKFYEPKKWFYLKHDGSLSNGFELVTHPATLSGHRGLPWEELCNEYKKLHIRADNTTTCGLHIHVNKDIIDTDHQIRLGLFVSLNKPMMQNIARRSSSYAVFKDANGRITDMNRPNGRYEALNWSPSNTVEFRLFKGTVLYSTLMASIEFAHACVAFTKGVSLEEIQHKDSWKAFVKFVRNTPIYNHLNSYMAERGVV